MHYKVVTLIIGILFLTLACSPRVTAGNELNSSRNTDGCRSKIPKTSDYRDYVEINSPKLEVILFGEKWDEAKRLLGQESIKMISIDAARVLTEEDLPLDKRIYIIGVCTHNFQAIKSNDDLLEWHQYSKKFFDYFPESNKLILTVMSMSASNNVGTVPMIFISDYEIDELLNAPMAAS